MGDDLISHEEELCHACGRECRIIIEEEEECRRQPVNDRQDRIVYGHGYAVTSEPESGFQMLQYIREQCHHNIRARDTSDPFKCLADQNDKEIAGSGYTDNALLISEYT